MQRLRGGGMGGGPCGWMEAKPEGEGNRARIGQQSLGTGVWMVLGEKLGLSAVGTGV